MLGEATHGGAQFYDERARLTPRLIDDERPRAGRGRSVLPPAV